MLSIVPVESDPAQESCPNCGAAVAADQQYCLTCGRPCAPLRLPFLEVLASAPMQRAPSAPLASNGYLPPLQSSGSQGPLHRYTGLFALIGVLLLTAVIGLLIGHWASGSGGSASSGPQVIKLEGLSGTGGATGTGSPESTTGTGSTANSGGKGSGSKASEHETKAEEKETKEAKLPPPSKQSSSSVQKLSKLSGKQAEEEIKKIGSSPAPIVTGG